MPDIASMPPDDVKFLREQGWTDAEITAAQEAPNPNNAREMSGTQASLATLKAHGGGIIGGGAGAIGGMMGGAELGALGGPSAPVTVPLGGLIGGIVGGLGGGYGGQKIQNAIQSDATNQAQLEAAQQAEQEHPYISGGTDLAASALASGGILSPSTAIKGVGQLIGRLGGRELGEEGRNVAMQSLLNPAIATGQSLAQGQGIPSIGELSKQALGGALFAKTWLPNGRVKVQGEPQPEVNDKADGTETTDSLTQSPGEQETQFTSRDEDGQYKLSNKSIQRIFKSNMLQTVPKDADQITKEYVRSRNEKLASQSADEMRQQLHQNELNKTVQPDSQEDADYQGGHMPEVTQNWNQQPVSERTVPKVTTQNILPNAEVNTSVPQKQAPIAQPASKAVSPNTLRITKDSLLQSNIGRPEIKPNTKVEGELESKAENTPTLDHPKSAAELAEEQYETKGNVNSQLSDYNRYQELQKQMAGKTLKETEPLRAEMEAIKNRNGGMVPKQFSEDNVRMPIALQAHIMSGKASTGSVLHGLATTQGHPFQELAHALLNALDTKSLNVPWHHDASLDISNEWRSHYDPSSDEVRIGSGASGDARVVMEEAVHSLTSKKIPHFAGQGAEHYNRLQTYLKTGKNESVKDLIKSYFKVANHLGIEKELFHDVLHGQKGLAGNADEVAQSPINAGRSTKYAMGNLDEFLAQAMKDHNFQRVLEGINDTDSRTVWQTIVSAVKNLLGLDAKKGTMLERVLRTGGELVNQERPEETASQHFDKPNQGTIPREELPKDRYMGKFGTITRAVIDKIHDIGTPIAHTIADHMKMALNKKDELIGKWVNPIVRDGVKLNQGQLDRIHKAITYEQTTKKSGLALLKGQEEKQWFLKAKQILSDVADHRIKIGEPVMEGGNPRLTKKDPWYWPGMANTKIEQVIRENKDIAAIQSFKDRFNEFNIKELNMTPDDSKSRVDNYVKALQGSTSKSEMSHQDRFNASRKAMGTPLPPEFREQNPVRNMERYLQRSAIDASHYEYMEKNPEILAALGQEKDAWNRPILQATNGSLANNQAIKSGLHQWKGEPHSPTEGNEQSLSALISSAFISGPPLEVHKNVSNIVKALSQTSNPIVLARAITHSLVSINQGYEHALDNGVVKLTARSTSQMVSASATAAEKMQSLAQVIRKVSTLGGLTTHVGTGLVQSMNEVIIPSKVARANAGDVTEQKFIRNLDPNYTKGKQYTPEEMQQLASRSASYIHGTGDIRSMPAWMLNDSEFSGFFSLAHWSIAQTNNFMRDVYEPATRGDIKPLLVGAFGAAIGGYLIKELRQDIQGKKSPIPSLGEIAASEKGLEGNKSLIAYNMIAAMQYSGFGGLLSQVAKYPFDFAYKNVPQGATFPLDEVASDLGKTLHEVSVTIANDPNVNWVDLASHVAMHVLSTNIQLARIGINQGINHGLITGLPAEKKDLSDRLGQLRRFDMVTGLPYAEQDEASNPYMNLEQKHFKLETDPQKAIAQLPDLISNIMKTYGSQPDVMMAKLQALKQNAYATFPSLEKMPLSAMKYIAYLQKSEEPEQAQEELRNYLTHKTVNEIKASAVP